MRLDNDDWMTVAQATDYLTERARAYDPARKFHRKSVEQLVRRRHGLGEIGIRRFGEKMWAVSRAFLDEYANERGEMLGTPGATPKKRRPPENNC